MENLNLKLEHSEINDKDFIKGLYQYYLHDLSEFNDALKPNSMGLFESSWIDDYYQEDNLIPLNIILDNNIIGFIFCSTGRKVDYIIQDAFILRNHRNKGFGKLIVKKLFNLYPGKYGLDVLIDNKLAELFWKSCFKDLGINYTSHEVTEDGTHVKWLVFDSEN